MPATPRHMPLLLPLLPSGPDGVHNKNIARGPTQTTINFRRERDSNPRYAVNVYTISNRAPSATRTPLLARKRILTKNQLVCLVSYQFSFF